MTSKARRIWRKSPLFAETVAALSVASLAIAILPFRVLVRLMGRRIAESRAPTSEAIAEVRAAILRVGPHLPWRVVCFQKGLAAHWMLRRRGFPSRLHYGLGLFDDDLSAHVWVTLGGKTVIGEETEQAHTCLAVFPAE